MKLNLKSADCNCIADHKQIILSRVSPGDDGCWNWQTKLTPAGYGILSHNGCRWLSHRFSYTVFVGKIPAGLVVDHLCRNRACANPEHLEPVTQRENVQRGLLSPTFGMDVDAQDHEIARQYLRLTAVQMEQAVRNRALYTKLARAYGMTNQAIAVELGMTEAGVRKIAATA